MELNGEIGTRTIWENEITSGWLSRRWCISRKPEDEAIKERCILMNGAFLPRGGFGSTGIENTRDRRTENSIAKMIAAPLISTARAYVRRLRCRIR